MDATREKLVSDFKVLISDAEELLRVTAGQAGGTIDSVRRRIEQSLEEGKHSLAEAEVLLVNKGREAAKTTDVYVREHPWNAVSIAAGVGVVVGLLMRRR